VIGGMLRVLVITLVLLVAALMLMPRPSPHRPTPEVATLLDAPRELPAVALTDQQGQPLTLADLAGRPVLAFFGFTNCPDICPQTLFVLSQAIIQLRTEAPAAEPAVLFVSVDPGRDSPALIHRYLAGFDPGFIGATAAEDVLAPLLSTLAVSVRKETRNGETYNVVHNGTVYVLDSAGRWAALFGGSNHRAEIIVRDYLELYPAL
jgi:protein SCO1/2